MPPDESWDLWRFTLSMFYDREVAPSNRIFATWESLVIGWQLRRGSVELAHAGGRLRAGPGDWVLIPPGLARRHRFSDDAAIRSIRCHVLGSDGQPPVLGLPPLRLGPDAALDGAADGLARSLHDEARSDLVSWAARQAAVISWCALACVRLGITGERAPAESRVAAAQRLLLARPSPAALPWGELNDATGLSRPQLDRLFRRHCGGSVRAWAESRLLADACAALGDREEPVKAVAGRLGFGDASHFCRWFRQRTGASPADWRRRGGT
jgi:AraC-like DNA-binding protein